MPEPQTPAEQTTPAEPAATAEPAAERLEVQRLIEATPAAIFRVLCDPQGHVAIDSTGMLMDATGEPVAREGDSFVVHMDREALNDYPMGKYDVTVIITRFEQDSLIEWTISGAIQPPLALHEVGTLDVSPDGQLIATDKDVRAIRDGKVLLALSANDDTPTVVAFAPDGRSLAVARNLTIAIWDVAGNGAFTNPIWR